MKIPFLIVILIVLFSELGGIAAPPCYAQSKTETVDSSAKANLPIDVLHYDAEIFPDLENKILIGKVSIQFRNLTDKLSAVELDAKDIAVESVSENDAALSFQTENGKFFVRLLRPAAVGEIRALTIRYRGKATNFVRFFPDHLYAYYNTPNWMVCHFHPGDKATFDLRLRLPADWKVAANGNLVEEKSVSENQKQYFWRQDQSVPPFVLGFAAGRFQEVFGRKREVRLRYLARDVFSTTEIERIFADAPDMLDFFETKAGVSYPGKSYTQILATGAYGQELSDFTVMGENTGRAALAAERDNHIIVHELAHQWWGSRVSCANWSHFWLNEAMAEFMTAAYRERRFGRGEYEDDIEKARAGYARIREAGRDRALGFRQPILESQAGGAIVYDKGLLILHLLRFEIGDKAFWEAVKNYTRKNFGTLVVTDDFQTAMEKASGKRLANFFERWVYQKGVPDLAVQHYLKNGKLVVEIEQRQNELYEISLNVVAETSRGRQTRRIIFDGKRRKITFPFSEPLLSVRIDGGGNLPFYVSHERPLNMLIYQLRREPDVAGRTDALRELQSLMQKTSDDEKAQITAAFKEAAEKDQSRLIRSLARKTLSAKE